MEANSCSIWDVMTRPLVFNLIRVIASVKRNVGCILEVCGV